MQICLVQYHHHDPTSRSNNILLYFPLPGPRLSFSLKRNTTPLADTYFSTHRSRAGTSPYPPGYYSSPYALHHHHLPPVYPPPPHGANTAHTRLPRPHPQAHTRGAGSARWHRWRVGDGRDSCAAGRCWCGGWKWARWSQGRRGKGAVGRGSSGWSLGGGGVGEGVVACPCEGSRWR